MAGQHWVAIGDDVYDTAKASVGRKVGDGILFRVAVSIAGRRVIALIDGGASQSYIAPETVTVEVAVFGGGPVRQFALDQAAVATHTARDDVTADIPRGTSLWLGMFGKSSL